jgi:hypothetical protein
MLRKSSAFMIVLLVTASLIGISSIYQPTNVETQSQQRSGTMIGKITHTIVYSSSDGKACLANAQISTRLYHPDYPFGLKHGNFIMLISPDESICDLLGQSSIAQKEIHFRVALAPLTLKAIPPTLREDLPSSQSLYRVIQIITGPGLVGP